MGAPRRPDNPPGRSPSQQGHPMAGERAPLDGSKILASFLPEDAMYKFLDFGRFGFIFIFIFLFLGGRIFWTVLSPVFTFLFNAFTWWQYFIN